MFEEEDGEEEEEEEELSLARQLLAVTLAACEVEAEG